MFTLSEEDEVRAKDDIYICGEICSPTEVEKGKIYVGGLFGISKTQNDSGLKSCRRVIDSNFIPHRNFSFSEESDVVDCDFNFGKGIQRSLLPSCHNDDYSLESDIHKVGSCPDCGEPLENMKGSENKMIPPFCEECKTYFVPEPMIGEKEILDNLVDTLLQNTLGTYPKGKIIFKANKWEAKRNVENIQRGKSVSIREQHNCQIGPVSWSEEEDRCILANLERITTDEEQQKILNDVNKTKYIAKRSIQKKVAEGSYIFAKDIGKSESKQLRCVICSMPLMEKKGKGTVCVTCPKILSKARKNARNRRLEEKEALRKLLFVQTDSTNEKIHQATVSNSQKEIQQFGSETEVDPSPVYNDKKPQPVQGDWDQDSVNSVMIDKRWEDNTNNTLQFMIDKSMDEVKNNLSKTEEETKVISVDPPSVYNDKKGDWDQDAVKSGMIDEECEEKTNNTLQSKLIIDESMDEVKNNLSKMKEAVNESEKKSLGISYEQNLSTREKDKYESCIFVDRYCRKSSEEHITDPHLLNKFTNEKQNQELPTIAMVYSDDSNECKVNWFQNNLRSAEELNTSHDLKTDVFGNDKLKKSDKVGGVYNAKTIQSSNLGEQRNIVPEIGIGATVQEKNQSVDCKSHCIHEKNDNCIFIDRFLKEKINERYERELNAWYEIRKPFVETLYRGDSSYEDINSLSKLCRDDENSVVEGEFQFIGMIDTCFMSVGSLDPNEIAMMGEKDAEAHLLGDHCREDTADLSFNAIENKQFFEESSKDEDDKENTCKIRQGYIHRPTPLPVGESPLIGKKVKNETHVAEKRRPVPGGTNILRVIPSLEMNANYVSSVKRRIEESTTSKSSDLIQMSDEVLKEFDNSKSDIDNERSEMCIKEKDFEITKVAIKNQEPVKKHTESGAFDLKINTVESSISTGENKYYDSRHFYEETVEREEFTQSSEIQPGASISNEDVNKILEEESDYRNFPVTSNMYENAIIHPSSTIIEERILDMQQYLENNCNFSFDRGNEKNAEVTAQKDFLPSINQAFTFSTWSSSVESMDNKSNGLENDLPIVKIQDMRKLTTDEVRGEYNLSENEEEETLTKIEEQIHKMKKQITRSGIKFHKDGNEVEVNTIIHEFEEALLSTKEIGEMIAFQEMKKE